jgi:hypothetical protein
MSTERILQQIERLSYLVGQHAGLLTHLETALPHHEDTIEQHPAHFIATAYLVPPPTEIPAEATPAPRRHPRTGHYPYYAVRVGRTTGIFTTNWADCFQATNGITNDFRCFESLDGVQHYLNL